MARITQHSIPNTEYQLKGTTIIESIVAMTIIAIAFAIGLMVVEMVLNSNKAAFKNRVQNAIYQEAMTTKDQQNYLDEILNYPDFFIERKASLYQDYEQVFELRLIAKDLNEQVILEHKELIYVP